MYKTPIILLILIALSGAVAFTSIQTEIQNAHMQSLGDSALRFVHHPPAIPAPIVPTSTNIVAGLTDASNWKNCLNYKYGFEFKCPANWSQHEDQNYSINDPSSAYIEWSTATGPVFSISIYKNKGVDERIAELKTFLDFHAGEIPEILADNIKAQYFPETHRDSYNNFIGDVLVSGNNTLFDMARISVDSSTFQTILSTFKFIAPTTVGATRGDNELVLLTLTGGETLAPGQTYPIKWDYQPDLLYKTAPLQMCLEAFATSTENEQIHAKKEYVASNACVHATLWGYPIASASTSNGVYNWTVPNNLADRFESRPGEYILVIEVLDGGRNINTTGEGPGGDWEGAVGFSWSASPLYLQQ